MKTDELITLLARDAAPVDRGVLPRRLSALALAGAAAALVIMVPWIGFRPDLPGAFADPTFWMKAIYTIGLGIAGFLLAERLSRPGANGRLGWALAAACAATIAALAAAQLLSMPSQQMPAAIMGGSWDSCPWLIFALALPGLAAILWTMRRFAPTRTALAGAAAGLLAGGVSATIYGLHCDENAAPFVAVWYSLGIAFTVITGALVGSRALRW
jgi:hypothetical protein